MRSTGSTIFHLPASFRHHLHLCILCIHHCTSLHVNNFLRAIIVYTARERRRRRHQGGLEVACTKFDTRPSLRTSSPSWGLHRKIRHLLVKSFAIFGSLHLDTKNRSTAALTSLHLQLLLLIEAIQKVGFWSSGFNSKLTFTPSPTEQASRHAVM